MLSFVVTIVLDIVLGIPRHDGRRVVLARARVPRRRRRRRRSRARGNMIAALRRLQGTKQLVDNSEPALATLKISGGRAMMA